MYQLTVAEASWCLGRPGVRSIRSAQDAPENRDAVTKGADGPPDYGYFESAAEFGLSITGELEHCCSFGPKSEFQEWLAGLGAQPEVRFLRNPIWMINRGMIDNNVASHGQ